MKRIVFRSLYPPTDPGSAVVHEQLYRVVLGNGTWCYFASTRHAEQFHAAAVEVLNDMLFRGNLLLSDAYQAWRLTWFYLGKPGTAHLQGVDVNAQTTIKDAEFRMDRALRRRGGEDYVHHAWRDVHASVTGVRELALLLSTFYRSKGHGVDRARMDVIVERANDLLRTIDHWGQTEQDAPNAKLIRRVRP